MVVKQTAHVSMKQSMLSAMRRETSLTCRKDQFPSKATVLLNDINSRFFQVRFSHSRHGDQHPKTI